MAGLFVAPIMGWVWAVLKRSEVYALSLITDDRLKDYERDTLRAIRAANPWARQLPTVTLVAAWSNWSKLQSALDGSRDFDITHWLDGTQPHRVRAFLSWAFTRPIDRY